MPFRPLLLAALALGLTAGCNNQQGAQQPSTTNEPGSAAPAPAQPAQPAQPTQPAQPPSEPGTGGAQQPAEGTAAAPQGAVTVYEVQLSGVRCIAAPCPTHLARPVNNPGDSVQVHELDLAGLNLPEERQQALLRRMEQGSVRVEARVDVRPKAGPAGDATVLKVTKVVDDKP
jgi:hypothetical protein